MILRNTAGQAVLVGPLTKADGTAETSGAAVKTRIDGITAAGGGMLTHISGGVWEYAPTQAETDTAMLCLILEKSGAISVPLTVPTTRFPSQTAGVLPVAAAGSAGGVPLIGSAPLSNLDATVSSRLASASYAAPPGAAAVATAVRSELATELAHLDGDVSACLQASAYVAAPDAAGIRAAIGMTAADLDTQLAALPTAAENADALLGRNVSGGSSSGRLVKEALYALRNKVTCPAGTLTVYGTDDATVAWTASLTTDASANPITGIDPA